MNFSALSVVFALIVIAVVSVCHWILKRRRRHELFRKHGIPGPTPDLTWGNYWQMKEGQLEVSFLTRLTVVAPNRKWQAAGDFFILFLTVPSFFCAHLWNRWEFSYQEQRCSCEDLRFMLHTAHFIESTVLCTGTKKRHYFLVPINNLGETL